MWIGFLHQGRYDAGTLDVDAQSGAILDRAQGVVTIRARATQIAAALPAYRPNAQVADGISGTRCGDSRESIAEKEA